MELHIVVLGLEAEIHVLDIVSARFCKFYVLGKVGRNKQGS